MIKKKLKDLKMSATLRINEVARELESQGKEIFKFGFGQSPFKVPKDVVLELKKNSYQNMYLPVQGLKQLRNAIVKNIPKLRGSKNACLSIYSVKKKINNIYFQIICI